MQLVNETALRPALVNNVLMARFIYSWQDAFIFEKEKTYGITNEEDLTITEHTSIYLHDLNERVIRDSSIEITGKKHRAVNATSFFSILKNHESVGKFNLPLLSYPTSMVISCGKGHEDALELPAIPILFHEHIHFEYVPIEPILFHMDYDPRAKDLTLILGYKPNPSHTTLIHYGETHAAQLESI